MKLHWTEILTFAYVLMPALLSAVLMAACLFPFGKVLWNNVVTLEVLQHLALHAVFYAPASVVVFLKFVLTETELVAFGLAIKLAGIALVLTTIFIGWLCGYRVVQLEVLNPHR